MRPHVRHRDATGSAFVRDRLLLLTVAVAVAASLFLYFSVSERLGVADDAQFLVLQTLGLAVFVSSVRRFSPWRRRKLRVKWPLVVVSGGLLLVHAATVGAFVLLYHPRWRAPLWELITVSELVVCFLVLGTLDEYCTLDRRPRLTAFLAKQLWVATGHINADDSQRD